MNKIKVLNSFYANLKYYEFIKIGKSNNIIL